MLKRDEFVKFILEGSDAAVPSAAATERQSALPSGFEGFETKAPHSVEEASSFARRLLEASGFGPAQYLEREEVILGGDASAKYLPDRVYYWPKTNQRPYQTILFELEQSGTELLQTPLFRPLKGQEILEDALSRLVQMALAGFERGGEKRTAAVKQGRQTETLCVVSVHDDREDASAPPYLVCLGTVSAETDALETFHIREAARRWERPLAEDHLTRLYDRHFSKLDSARWQDAFISGEERKLAEKLLEACTGSAVSEKSIQNRAIALLEELARGFGLRRKPNHETRLTLYSLPADHDIGADAEALEAKKEPNPFKGVALRDEGERLLGYIIYCVNGKKRADELRAYLAKNNRFHNVLVIYPSGKEAVLELWQGQTCLEGKLTQQGARFEGAGKTVNLLSRFFVVSRARMKNPKELAEELAYRARYLRRLAMRQLGEEKKHDHLRSLHEAFKVSLIHKQTEEQFADAYAQTITYGLLAARWISKDELAVSAERFTRENALKYVQRTSPFLREFFKEVLTAGAEVKLTWLRDDIIDLLARADIDAVFGAGDLGSDQSTDPVIHFYEPFLAAFDKQIKVERGVFYTPRPVVSYIVRSVHEILQREFGLEDGLASTITWGEITRRLAGLKIPDAVRPGEPFVTILDPATGTATFLVAVIDVIHRTLVAKWSQQGLTAVQQQAAWNDYVPKHLLPRLYGYELMVAPYAVAHMKIALTLKRSGYRFSSDERVRVYLTNALEPPQDFSDHLAFDAPAVAHEAQAVNAVKHHQRFTVVVGNPPYAGYSANEGAWIEQLMERYKTTVREEERQIQRLSNDYVKFIRFSESLLTDSQTGLLGFITDSGYLSGILFRDMRAALRDTFQQIWILDLHGAAMRGAERHVGVDQNVFDITQGVAIGIFARRALPASGEPINRYAELLGERQDKYAILSKASALNSDWLSVNPTPTKWLFVPSSSNEDYDSWPLLTELIGTGSPRVDRDLRYGTGIKTRHDDFVIGWSPEDAVRRIKQVAHRKEDDATLVRDLGLCTTAHFSIQAARKRAEARDLSRHVKPIAYRPFDWRSVVYLREFVCEPKAQTMRHMLQPDNVALAVLRRDRKEHGAGFFVARGLIAKDLVSNLDDALVWPLYLIQCDGDLIAKKGVETVRTANVAPSAIRQLTANLGLSWCRVGRGDLSKSVGPEDMFHCFYAMLYSLGYRSGYADYLKMDFPRLPLPRNRELMRALSRLGGELVALHLMESPKLKKHITKFVGSGAPEVEKIAYTDKTVWIDKSKTQGFRAVSEDVWEFHIGAYQVCEKWLKDRKGRVLSSADIEHYHGIVVALNETIRLMGEIDGLIDKHGGWPGAFAADEAKPA